MAIIANRDRMMAHRHTDEYSDDDDDNTRLAAALSPKNHVLGTTLPYFFNSAQTALWKSLK